jgi:transcriptional regulator with AAA-type ATPase domain
MRQVPELLGDSRQIAAIRATVAQLLERWEDAQRLPPILIDGETGTGKGLIARALHRHGPRRAGPFVDVNCAAIPETLIEAEMFGFERGAFTEARQSKPGLFQAAHRGTLFLDEVGLLRDTMQGKLLKAIEDRTIRRLGSTRSEPVDVWVISASNEDLAAAARQQKFREDLYHRLAVVTLHLPPLRERAADVLLLAKHFLDRVAADYKLPPLTLAADARECLLRHSWPGNVRELSNVLERAALLADSSTITADMLNLPGHGPEPRPAARGRPLKAELGDVERERLLEALESAGWNLSRASEALGVPRNTLRYRMEKYGLRSPSGEPRGAAAVPSSARSPAPAPAGRGGRHWEPKRLTLLRIVLVPLDGAGPAAPHGGRALELLADKVEMFGGRLEATGPTDLVAAFGLDPAENITQRAAHAALAVARAIASAEPVGHDRWGVRQAIHAGQFLVGHGRGGAEIALDAKREAWVLLDALVDRADTGAIVASEAAAPLLSRHFELVPVRDAKPGGGIVRVIRREPTDGRAGRHAAVFVGRRQNLALLDGYLAATLRGRGHAVGIAGDAGIGKSRLIAEFRQRLTGQPVTYREATCASYGSEIPYLPVLDILRQDCGIAETDSTDAIRDKVRRSVAAVGMDETSVPYLLLLLGITEGIEALGALTPEAIKRRTLRTLREMILHASRQRPIVFVFEDLHWIDRTSEELLASLVEDLPGAPILFLSTYRPGYRLPWIDRSYATQMALLPLAPEDSLAVVRSVLRDDVPDALARVILDKAEGNPFFLEELCRAVTEQGDLAAGHVVPDTIQDVLLARIQRLPAGARSVLQTASVLGREVSARLLQAVWIGDEPIESALGVLTPLELLYTRREDEGSVYVFRHVLIQDVAYESLAPAERDAIHRAAGQALEELYEGRLQEVYDRLAHHYARTEQTAKAVEYLERFAEKSAHAYAHEEALKALTEALSRVPALPAGARDRKTLQLVLRLPYSLLPLGRIKDIVAMLLDHRDRLERVGDHALAAQYHFLLARAYMLGSHGMAGEHARRAIGEAEACGDHVTMGNAYSLLALADALSGKAARGIEHGRQAVALLEHTREQSSLSYAYWALGLACTQAGAFEAAIAAETQALRIADTTGDQPQAASASWVMGIIHAAIGEWERGIA